jgi:putative transposase
MATNPDAAKSRLRPAFGSKSDGLSPFDLAELDGTPSDALVVDTASGRCHILGMPDAASRAAVAVVEDGESTDAATRLFVKYATELGLPRAIRTDRGAGFKSARMRSFLDRMEIALEIVPPFSGDKKPFAEALMRRISQFLELEAGFAGHNVAERVRLRGRLSMAQRRGKSERDILCVKYTKAELEARINQFLRVEADRPRDALNGKTPNQIITEWQSRGGVVRRVQDEQALWALLAPAGAAAVTKKGLRVGGRVYQACELGSFEGHHVEWRRHPDTDRLVIYSGERIPRFICVARCTNAMSDAERQTVAMGATALFGVYGKAVRTEARRLKRGVGIPADIELGRELNARTVPSNVVPFTTPALIESGKAARAIAAEAGEPAPRMPNCEAAHEQYFALKRRPENELSERQRQFLVLFRFAHPSVELDEEAAS